MTAQEPGATASRVGQDAAPSIELRSVSRIFRRNPGFTDKVAALLGAKAPPGAVRAVDSVNLTIRHGEVVGLAGESGCGKSTLGRMVAGILKPSSGEILYRGQDIGVGDRAAARRYMREVQMIFQDPYTSLNPRLRVRDIVGEAPLVHGLVPRRDLARYVSDMLERVRMSPEFISRYPHQFSGGQRQRIGIARALAVQPKFIVCDESVAALDVSIQAQILNLFLELRRELDLSYLFISHDLGVIQHISDRVMIMYLGQVVEEAPTDELFAHPSHPYTRALLKEIPRLDGGKRRFQGVKGEIPSPLNPPSGCYFHPRCPQAMAVCRQTPPALREIAPGHKSACHLDGVAA